MKSLFALAITALLATISVETASAQTIGAIINRTSSYTCHATNSLIVVDASSAACVITLATANAPGQVVTVLVTNGTNNVTVAPGGADVIVDPAGGRFMGGTQCSNGEAVTLESNGSGSWYVTMMRNSGCGNWVTSSSTATAQATVPKGTASGQMIFWNNTTKHWVLTDANFAATLTTSGTSGLEIHCKSQSGNSLNHNTEFISFYDGAGANRGSIQGQNAADYLEDPFFVAQTAVLAAKTILTAALDVAAGLGALEPAEEADIVAQNIELAAEATSWGIAFTEWQSKLGVAYESSAGDYAEYMKRADATEKLYPGDIVGVKNGVVSKNTANADNILPISLAPIVLGNVPPKGKEGEFSKVAFLGQVPVKVRGDVRPGDFIVASGLNDGLGVAVGPQSMTAKRFAMVVGRAWDSVTATVATPARYVTVAVGLNAKAMSEIAARQEEKLDALAGEVAALREESKSVHVSNARRVRNRRAVRVVSE